MRFVGSKAMIPINPQMRILVAIQPVDFRKGIDGLAATCRQVLKENPMDGALFLFCNRRRHAIKVLVYDGQGFGLCQKRLSNGRFKGWARGDEAVQTLAAHQVQLLLWNGDPMQAKAAPLWRRIPA